MTKQIAVGKDAVGISETNLEHQIQLFPNPASNVLTIQNAENSLVLFKIVDIIGREIDKGEFINSKTIDISNYANGTYVIAIESEGTRIFKKIVVEK